MWDYSHSESCESCLDVPDAAAVVKIRSKRVRPVVPENECEALPHTTSPVQAVLDTQTFCEHSGPAPLHKREVLPLTASPELTPGFMFQPPPSYRGTFPDTAVFRSAASAQAPGIARVIFLSMSL